MAKRPKPEPVMVPIDPLVLGTARAMHPIARDWTDAQLVAASLALVAGLAQSE